MLNGYLRIILEASSLDLVVDKLVFVGNICLQINIIHFELCFSKAEADKKHPKKITFLTV